MSQLLLPLFTTPEKKEKPAKAAPAQPGHAQAQPGHAQAPAPAGQLQAQGRHTPGIGRAVVLPEEGPRDARERQGLALAARLAAALREPVEVELTDNAWTMVSYRRVAGRLTFRLHHMFGGVSETVLRALAGFTGKSRRIHGRVIDEHVRAHRALIRQAPRRTEPVLSPRGRVHDLADIYGALNASQFGNQVSAHIGWGRRAPSGRRRSIKMGVYFHDQKLIRLHPALDDERVPRHFVELVVFHEMLHQVIPPRVDARGRRTVHSREFRAAERLFPGYQRARAWEKANIHLLLRPR